MRYLAYFEPNEKLSDLILKQKHIDIPNSGLHSTLFVFEMKEDKEEQLIRDLSEITFSPFEIKTFGFEKFINNALVLRFSRPHELLQLHKNIVNITGKYFDETFNNIVGQYFGKEYKPHLTISNHSSKFDTTSKELIAQKDRITKYTLAKKIDKNWKDIQIFYSTK